MVGWTRREDVLTKKADGGNGHEGKLETNIIEIEGIDAQHDEESECAGVDGHQFAGKRLAEQEDGEHGGGTDERR